MDNVRTITDCPFCAGDIDGCCFCDHSGKIYVGGEEDFFKNEQQVKDSLGVKFLKEQDAKNGTEAWPEMIEYFLDDKMYRIGIRKGNKNNKHYVTDTP